MNNECRFSPVLAVQSGGKKCGVPRLCDGSEYLTQDLKAASALAPVVIAALLLMLGVAVAPAQTAPLTNSVTGPSQTTYFINGQANPTLTLQRGITYRFQVNASIHPFFIQTNRTAFGAGRYNVGVTNNGVAVGTLIFAVPQSAPNLLHYQCGSHESMGGDLIIVDAPAPPPPPDVAITAISVTDTTVTVQSTGAVGWSPVPQFSSNLVLNIWSDVAVFENVFADGTNTTTFDRLDPICGPNVYLRVRNTEN
jgi:hypothetical protein